MKKILKLEVEGKFSQNVRTGDKEPSRQMNTKNGLEDSNLAKFSGMTRPGG